MKMRRLSLIMLIGNLLLIGLLGVMTKEENGEKTVMGTRVEQKKVALTFDDGPSPVYTELLLNGLKERKVPVTFFMTGQNVEKYPKLVKRAMDEGHLIGNHTYNHIQLTKNNKKEFMEELTRTNATIESITGKEVMFVRPPYGTWNKSLEKQLNMIPVLWSVDAKDWCCHDTNVVAERVLSKVKENDIILLHDQYEATVNAAFLIIEELQKRGYTFVTVEDILLE